jgi:F5/8 type C domain
MTVPFFGRYYITIFDFEDDPGDYHPATYAIDGESCTWLANQGENSWLKIDLGNTTSLCEVNVQSNKGDERRYTFEISTSENGNEFKKIFGAEKFLMMCVTKNIIMK